MRAPGLSHALSTRAPTIVVTTLLAALAFYWLEVPDWVSLAVALAVAIAALVQMAGRKRSPLESQSEEDDELASAGVLAQELAGRGSPSGSYLLGFFCLVVIVITGFDDVYTLPAWAALALTAAWGVANARFLAPGASEG